MLKRFTFRNGYSFRDEETLNMEAVVAMKDNVDFVTIRGDSNQHILPVAAIYGANAGGKTNVIRSLINAARNICGRDEGIQNEPFKIQSEINTEFEHCLVFITNEFEFEYKYSADNGGFFGDGFYLSETLKRRPVDCLDEFEIIFSRCKDKIEISPTLNGQESGAIKLAADNMETLIITSAGLMGIPGCKEVRAWCERILTVTYMRGERERDLHLRRLATWLIDKPEKLHRLSDLMRKLDPTIVKVDVVQDNVFEEAGRGKHSLYVWHKSHDSEYNVPLQVYDESNGTKKLIEIYYDLDSALENGWLLVFDELDIMLHPLVFKELVSLFNHNRNGAQIIFTAHNTIIMNREDLRRDEIHFVMKDSNSVSSIFRLCDVVEEDGRKIRMDASYDRWYLEGRIGATPSDFFNLPVGGE